MINQSHDSAASDQFRGLPIYTQPYPSFGSFDQDALRRLIRAAAGPGCRMLEVGSWLGSGSTQIFIQELRDLGGMLYCVDTWRGTANVARHQELIRSHDVFATFRHNVRAGGGEDVVRPLILASLEAASLLADHAFDLIFLDGDHSYGATAADIRAWRPKVRPGGLLCGHDCEARLTTANQTRYRDNREADHIDGAGTPFAANHPGVIVAVHEAFDGGAHLWADEPAELLPGNGRATLWDVRV